MSPSSLFSDFGMVMGHILMFFDKVFYVMCKALSAELSYLRTGFVG